MGDHLGTRVVAGSNVRYCRIPLGYGCPTRAVAGQATLASRAQVGRHVVGPKSRLLNHYGVGRIPFDCSPTAVDSVRWCGHS
jgi:hypothetical protein